MKLQFDANLDYQEQAVSSIVDLFRRQTPMQSSFSVSAGKLDYLIVLMVFMIVV